MPSDHIIEERSVRPPQQQQQQQNVNQPPPQPSQPSPGSNSATGRSTPTPGNVPTISHGHPVNIQPANPAPRNVPADAAAPRNVPAAAVTQRNVPAAADQRNVPAAAVTQRNVPAAADQRNVPAAAVTQRNVPAAADQRNVPAAADQRNVPAAADQRNVPAGNPASRNAQSVNPPPRNMAAVHPTLRNVQSAPPHPQQVSVSPVRTYVTTNTIVNGKLVSSSGELPPGCPPIDVDAILRSAGLGPSGSANVTTKTYSTTTTNRNFTVNGQPVANADKMGIFDNFDKLFENVDKDGNVQPDPDVLNDFVSKFSRSFSLPETSAPPVITTGSQTRPGSVPVGARAPPSGAMGAGASAASSQQGAPSRSSANPGGSQSGPGNPGGNQSGPGNPGCNQSGSGNTGGPPVDVDAILRSVGLDPSGQRATSAPQGQTRQSVHKTYSTPVANSKINICNGAKISGNRVIIGGNVSSGGNGGNAPDRPAGNLDINLGDGVEIEAKEELLIGCGNTRMDDFDLGGVGKDDSKKKKELAEKEAKEKKLKAMSKAICFITNDHGTTVGNGFFAEWEGFGGLAFITDGNIFKDNMEQYNLHFKSSGDLDSAGAVSLSLKSILGHRHEMVVAGNGQRRVIGTGVDRMDDTDKGNVYTALLLGPGFRQIIKDMDLSVLKMNMAKESIETVCYIGHTRNEGINGPLKFTNVKVESSNEHKIEYNLGQEGELTGGPLVDGDYFVRAIHVSDKQGKDPQGNLYYGQNINPVISDLYQARLRIIRRSLDGTGRRMC